MDQLTREQAEALCAEYGVIAADRDVRVLAARSAYVPVSRIAELMGIGHATVDRIIARHRRGVG